MPNMRSIFGFPWEPGNAGITVPILKSSHEIFRDLTRSHNLFQNAQGITQGTFSLLMWSLNKATMLLLNKEGMNANASLSSCITHRRLCASVSLCHLSVKKSQQQCWIIHELKTENTACNACNSAFS